VTQNSATENIATLASVAFLFHLDEV